MGNVVGPLWSDCPALARIIAVGYPGLNVLMMVAGWAVSSMQLISMYGFFCCLATVLQKYCIWTIFTGAFYRPIGGGGGGMGSGMSFLMMLLEIYMAMVTFPQLERDKGSTTFLCWMLLMNGTISVFFLLIMYILSVTSQGGGMYWMTPNTGLWPMILLSMSLRCLANPDSSTNFWGVAQIPNKWYPLCIAGFFCLMGGFQWNIIVAVALGYAYPYLRLERLLPSRTWANSIENRCCGTGGRACFGAYWVRAADTAGYEIESGDRRYATLSDFGRSSQGQQLSSSSASTGGEGRSSNSANFVAFSGSGNRLGEGEADAIVPQQTETTPAAPQEQEMSNTVAPTTPSHDSSDLANQS